MKKTPTPPVRSDRASPVNSEFVERYQIELQRNPSSQVFAPLAEAYRKMGLHDEGIRICKRGISAHPDFAGGYVAYAKLLIDSKDFTGSFHQLTRAVQLSPDNLLAHSLLGESLIELRRPKEALKAFKMVLFLNPSDERAKEAVRKWEFLTAEEFSEDVFEMRPVFTASDTSSGSSSPSRRNPQVRQMQIERAISLADAFTVRNDLKAAIEVLENARTEVGRAGEIENRLRLIERRAQVLTAPEEVELPAAESDVGPAKESVAQRQARASTDRSSSTELKRARLMLFLQRINERRSS